MKDSRNMTVGTPWKQIAAFALPILLSQLFQQLYNSADSLIVGNFLGKEALAAVSSSGNLIFLIVSFFSGTAMGAGVVISRHFGAGNLDAVSKAIHTNVAFGLLSGVLLTVFGVAATPVILRWMGTAESVLPQAIRYFRFYFAGALANVMYNIFTGIMNAVGDSRRPLYYLVFSSLLNIALDLLFVGALGFGVAAAAVATVISQAASAALCLKHLLRKDVVCRVELKKIRLHRDMLGQILKYGLPTGVQNSVIGFANVIVQSNINAFGADAMAAFGSYSKVEGFGFLPITCFSMALATFIGQNLGARQYDRAKKGARFGILTSITLAECIGLLIYCFSPALIRMFSSDPGVIALGVQQARTASLFYFLLAFSHCVAGVCRGAGKAVVPMSIMLAVWCVLRIIYITLVVHFTHEIRFIYWAYPITWSISSVIYLLYYRFSDWVHGFDQPSRRARRHAAT